MTSSSPLFHVDGERGFRGGERQLLYLAAALRARGRRNVIWCRRGEGLEAEARRQGFEVGHLPFLNEYDPFSAGKLYAAAKREGAILHAHTGHAAGVCALASLGGIPFVAHRRVDFDVSAFARTLKYGLSTKIISVSAAIQKILVEAGLPGDKIIVVPDGLPVNDVECSWTGVDSVRYKPPSSDEKKSLRRSLCDELGLDPSMTFVGNLAALVPHKDHDTLLAAAVIVLLKRPRARFLIAGRGPEEMRLLESIKRMGLSGKVLLVGHREDPMPFMKALDLYVQSSWGEGMGSVLIEAASCGVPIAATTAGGIPEVVEDGVTGLLVLPRRPEALADALVRLMDDPALARRFADAGRSRLERFGLKRMADSVEKVYAEALDES